MREAEDVYAIPCNTTKPPPGINGSQRLMIAFRRRSCGVKLKKLTGTDQMSPRHPDPTSESNRILNGFVERCSSMQLPHGPPEFSQAKIINTKAQQSRADRPITSEVTAALKKANHSAPEQDAISYEMMKQVPASYLTALAKLYTISLKSGKLPRAWKEAKIVPIPKKATMHIDRYHFYQCKAN